MHTKPNHASTVRAAEWINRHIRGVVMVALLTVAALLCCIASAQGTANRTCFPAASWDAPQGERPCASIVRVEEDGSVRVRVTDADGTPRYMVGVGAKDR